MKLFGKGLAPLFRLTKNGKVSHLFGSCHIVPISDLHLSNNTISRLINPRKEENFIIDFLKNKETLITEPGIILSKYSYTLDTDKEEKDIRISQLKDTYKGKEIYDEKDFYRRFVKLYLILHNEKRERKGIFPFVNLLKNDKIYDFIREIQTKKIKIDLTNVGLGIYSTLISSGIDCYLINSYVNKGKPVYGLDFSNSNKIDKYLIKSTRLLLLITFLLSKIRKSNIVDETNLIYKKTVEDYLYKSWNLNSRHSESFIITGRNKSWLPLILRYHNETEDPLFVVGAFHLNNLIELLKEEKFEIEIFDMKELKFIKK